MNAVAKAAFLRAPSRHRHVPGDTVYMEPPDCLRFGFWTLLRRNRMEGRRLPVLAEPTPQQIEVLGPSREG